MTETISVLCVEDGSVDIEELENEGLKSGKIITYLKGSKPPYVLTLTKQKSIPIEKWEWLKDYIISICKGIWQTKCILEKMKEIEDGEGKDD